MAVGALIPPVQLSTSALVGAVYPGALLTTTLSGGSTPQSVYADYALTTPLSNPVEADSNGVFPVMYLAAVAYRVSLTDADGNVLITAKDHVYDFGETQLAASGGSALVGFIQSGTGAVARTAQAKMREWVTAQDFGAVGDGTTDDTAAINAALVVGNVRLTGGATMKTYKTTGTLLVGSNGVSRCLWIDAGVTLAYTPTTGTAPAVSLYDASSVLGESRRRSVITVSRDGCDGIKTIANVAVDNKPLIASLSIRDIAASRASGAGVNLDISSGMRSVLRDLEISQFFNGVYANKAFSSTFDAVNCEGCLQDGFHFEGSGTSLNLVTTYANNVVRHGYYFSGGQEYCTLTGTSADSGGTAGGSGWGYKLDKTAGAVCKTFTFNSIGMEAPNGGVLGAVYCEEGSGHVFNAPNLVNTVGSGSNNGIWFAGTIDVIINRGLISGWRGGTTAIGHDIVAVTSAGSVAPANIVVFNPAANDISFPTQNGRFYAPNGGIALMQAPTAWVAPTLGNSWVNAGAPLQVAEYRRDADNIVEIRGIVKSGTATPGLAFFTLPANFRPAAQQFFPTVSINGGGTLTAGMVIVDTDGTVQYYSGSNNEMSIALSFVGADVALNSQTPL